jgi:hypothetical protein
LEIEQHLDIKPGDLRCPRCLRLDVVPSRPRGIADMFMEGLGKVPRHCRSCGKRFYVNRERLEDDSQKEKAGA